MPEYPRSPFKKTDTSITPRVAGDQILLAQDNDAANPTIAFGDGDTGFYESADDSIAISIGGTHRWSISDSSLGIISTNYPVLKRVASTNVNPNVLPSYADADTGIGHADVDTLSFITGGVEGHRITEATGVITHELTGTVQGPDLNNQMVSKATFDILGLMTDPRFLNVQCEDPSAGTMVDVSGQGNDGTYYGTMTSGDRVKLGMGWAVDLDGSNDYITIADTNDLSFGDASNDEAVTWFGVLEVVDTAVDQMLFTKYDEDVSGKMREWAIILRSTEVLRLIQCDESVNVTAHVDSDTALSIGVHSYAITSPGDGGATAMNNVKVYVDGVSVACTATNDASYVAMENLAVEPIIGAYLSIIDMMDGFFQGDIALTGVDGSEWSAMTVRRFHQLCKGLYNI